MLSEAERQSAIIRLRVEEQCGNVNEYMASMMLAIDNLAMACTKTREIATAGFSEFQTDGNEAAASQQETEAETGMEQEMMSEDEEVYRFV